MANAFDNVFEEINLDTNSKQEEEKLESIFVSKPSLANENNGFDHNRLRNVIEEVKLHDKFSP